MPTALCVTLIRQSLQWRYVRLPFDDIVSLTLKTAKAKKKGQIALVLADDAAIQSLNHDFRGKNKPTNVLSFPSDAPDELGDVILAYETIAKEAQEQEKPLKHHITHLIVHGTLHLLGFDHENDQEARVMELLEIQILSKLAIENPYNKT